MVAEIIFPTPEREAKGDLTPYKQGGRALSTLRIDDLLLRGIINNQQHITCVRVRRWHDISYKHFGCKAFDFGAASTNEGDVEGFAAEVVDAHTQYTHLMNHLHISDAFKFSSVVCYDESLRKSHTTGSQFRLICDEVEKIIKNM